MDKWRVAYLQALGGRCIFCGERNFALLEVHDMSGEHRGIDNPARLTDLRDFKEKGIIHDGRAVVCWKCHHKNLHGSPANRVKFKREKEIEQLRKEGVIT